MYNAHRPDRDRDCVISMQCCVVCPHQNSRPELNANYWGAKEANQAARCSDGTLSRALQLVIDKRESYLACLAEFKEGRPGGDGRPTHTGTEGEGKGKLYYYEDVSTGGAVDDGGTHTQLLSQYEPSASTQSYGCPIDYQWAEPSHVASSTALEEGAQR